MDNRSPRPGGILDRAAIALSGLCLLHCLALPLIILVLPALGADDGGHFHVQMLIVVVPVSVVAFAMGIKRHRRYAVVAAGVVGIGLMAIGATVAHDRFGLLADTLLTVSGALILATAHFYNSKLSRHRARPSADS